MRRTLVIGLLAASGCLMRDVNKDPTPQLAIPERFSAGENTAGDAGRWWKAFGDPELDRLVNESLEHNLQLKQAWARLDQGKALQRLSMAGLFPSVDARLSAGRSKSPTRVIDLGGFEQKTGGNQTNSFDASLPLSYEIDAWGRVRSGMYAADHDAEALRADVDTIATTVAASVAEKWFDVLEQRARRSLLEQQMKTSGIFLDLVQLRFREAQASLSDVLQQKQSLQALQAQLTIIEGQERVAQQQLAVLLGGAPKEVMRSERANLPAPPPLPGTGIPASLLQRRPDLRAAQRRVIAADYRIAQAIAARFPTLALSGSMGFSAVDLASFFDGFVWNFLGSISASIWDGGARSAEVDRTKAVLDERVYAYGEALLTALLEVESTLVLERQQRRYLEALGEQLDTARRTVQAARTRFEGGDVTFLPTLTALASLQAAEQNQLAARRQLLSLRVQLYRALGSRWTDELKPPDAESAPHKQEPSSEDEPT